MPGLDSMPRPSDGGPYLNEVGSGYFTAMGLEILRGRGFDEADDAEGAAPVAVVAESMARALWPAGDAPGGCLLIEPDADPDCTTVVDIVEDHRRQTLTVDRGLRRPAPSARRAYDGGALAEGSRIVQMVVRQALALVGFGVVAGLLVAGGTAPFVEPLLFEGAGRDPLVFGGAAALLLGVALVASVVPTLRATAVDPATVLRTG